MVYTFNGRIPLKKSILRPRASSLNSPKNIHYKHYKSKCNGKYGGLRPKQHGVIILLIHCCFTTTHSKLQCFSRFSQQNSRNKISNGFSANEYWTAYYKKLIKKRVEESSQSRQISSAYWLREFCTLEKKKKRKEKTNKEATREFFSTHSF